jgi:hypothetical protein
MGVKIAKLKAIKDWKYTEEWLDKKYGDSYGGGEDDKIKKYLLSYKGSRCVREYIYEQGPATIACQRHLNRFIDKVVNGEFDDAKTSEAKKKFIDRFKKI